MSEHRMRQGATEPTMGGSFIVDDRGTILGFDRGMERLTGWAAVDVVGRSREATGHDGMELPPIFSGEIPTPGRARREVVLGCRDGSTLEVETAVTRHTGGGNRVTVNVLRVIARSGRPASEGDLDSVDPLTGLASGRAFQAILEREFAAAAGRARPLALVLADIDHLRYVNDRSGRAAGNEVLRKLAGILRATVAEERLIARLRDDDFALVLPGAGRGEARQVAARIRSTVERFRFFGVRDGNDPGPKLTLSLGAASFPADAESARDLLARASDALREARGLGRNRVWCYTRRPRVPIHTPVYFDGAEPSLVGYATDLSPSGIFVQTSIPVEIGMRCAFAFPLPSHDGNVHVIGRVVRAVPVEEAALATDARVPGLGVEFERFGAQDRRAIEAFLYKNESSTKRPERAAFSV